MSRGSYSGGSTVIRPGSNWFSYGKKTEGKKDSSVTMLEREQKQKRQAEAVRTAEIKKQEKQKRKAEAEQRQLEKIERRKIAYAAQKEKWLKNPRPPKDNMLNVEVVLKKHRRITHKEP